MNDISKRGAKSLRGMFSRICFVLLCGSLALGGLASCSDAGDLLDLALDSPDRRPIDKSRVGVNNFFVNREFGSIPEQYQEIRDTLGIRFVRVLVAWTTDVQPTPTSTPVLGFFDSIIEAIPPGVDVLIVVSHAPEWLANQENWIAGSPRVAWVKRCFEPIVRRYGRVPGVIGFEVWNEPDAIILPTDAPLELVDPANYFEMLQFASAAVRDFAPGKLVVLGATESIQQDFPNHLRYNQALRDFGAEGLVDVWGVHYYGTRYESVVTSRGVADFLNSLSVPVWITESGETGPNRQLAYVEEAWPFLIEKIPSIQRIYYYQFGETVLPVENNFGLRTTDPAFPVSDLYLHLAER